MVMTPPCSDAPTLSKKLTVTEACDADLHASNLSNWQQEYDQISRGAFYGRIAQWSLSGLQVFCEYTSQALQQTCVVWPDSIWLGIPLSAQQSSRINGLALSKNSIMCRPGNCEFELSTPEDYQLYGLVVDQSSLASIAEIQGVDLSWQSLMNNGSLQLSAKTLADVRFVLARLLTDQHRIAPQRLQQDIVMMALLELLKNSTPQAAPTQSYYQRKRVVDLARQFIHSNLEGAVTVTQLCQAANVSRRTLQYSFETILGISPIQYLRVNRLNGVRRDLVKADKTSSVGDIAAQWGFWHLSQFAKDYKNLFDELPSKTLSGFY